MPIYKNKNRPGYRVQINYKDENGIYRQIVRSNQQTLTMKSAREYESELLRQINVSSSNVESDNMYFFELAQRYQDIKAFETRKSTQRHTNQSLNLYILPYFGKMKIKDIKPVHVQNWKIKLVKQHPNLSAIYLNTIYKVLSKIFNYAVEYHGLIENPAKKAKPFKNPNAFEESEELHYWTKDQFMEFYNLMYHDMEVADDFVEKITLSNQLTFFCILFFCGTRKGEAYCLTWNKIIDNAFKINQSMNQKTDPFEITAPKNKSSIRRIPICNFLRRRLDEHRALYQKVYGFNDDFYICGGFQPVRDTTVEQYKNKYAKKANLYQIRIHDFRHSFATLLINGNINIKTISQLMGHSTVDQTWNRYGHLYPESTNIAIEYINKILD